MFDQCPDVACRTDLVADLHAELRLRVVGPVRDVAVAFPDIQRVDRDMHAIGLVGLEVVECLPDPLGDHFRIRRTDLASVSAVRSHDDAGHVWCASSYVLAQSAEPASRPRLDALMYSQIRYRLVMTAPAMMYQPSEPPTISAEAMA